MTQAQEQILPHIYIFKSHLAEDKQFWMVPGKIYCNIVYNFGGNKKIKKIAADKIKKSPLNIGLATKDTKYILFADWKSILNSYLCFQSTW